MYSMLKRRWLWTAVLLLVAVIVASFLLVPAPRISQATCDKIKLGMTMEELENLLGPDDLSVSFRYFRTLSSTTTNAAVLESWYRHNRLSSGMDWRDEDGNRIWVRLDNELRADAKFYVDGNLSVAERLKRQFRRLMKRLGL